MKRLRSTEQLREFYSHLTEGARWGPVHRIGVLQEDASERLINNGKIRTCEAWVEFKDHNTGNQVGELVTFWNAVEETNLEYGGQRL